MDDLPAPFIAGSKLDPAGGVGELRPGQALKASQQAARQSSSSGLRVAGQELIPQESFPTGSGFGASPGNLATANGSEPLTPVPLLHLATVPHGPAQPSYGGHNGLLLGAQSGTAASLADAALKQSARHGVTQLSGMVPVGLPASQPSSMQVLTPALVPVAGPLPPAPGSVVEEQTRVLEALLDNISRSDSDRFFEAPVREAEAPGYSSIIKRPMSFQVMRQKVRQREYRTWHGFVEDFELIANNAMTYNQKRSRVHKAAITMLRAGKKHLQALELQGRKGISLLHPRGPQAAAADEAAERTQLHQHQQQHQPLTQPALLSPLATPSGPAMLSAQPRLSSGTHQPPSAHPSVSHLALQPHYPAGGSGHLRDAPTSQEPFDNLLPIDRQTEDEAGFSSFSDTDWDAEAAASTHARPRKLLPQSAAGSVPLAPSEAMAIPSGAEVLAKAPKFRPAVTAQPWETLSGSPALKPNAIRCKELPAAQQSLRNSQNHAGTHFQFPESLDIIAAAAAAVGWPPALQAFAPMPTDPANGAAAAAQLSCAAGSSELIKPHAPNAPAVHAANSNHLGTNSEIADLNTGRPTKGEPDDEDNRQDSGHDVSDSEDPPASEAEAAAAGKDQDLALDPKAIRLQKPGKVRHLEWQARWLQLRLRELQWQQHRASQQLAALEASQQANSEAVTAEDPESAAPGPMVQAQPDSTQSGTQAANPTQNKSRAVAAPAAPDGSGCAPAVDVPGEQPVTLEGMVGPPAHELAPPPAQSHGHTPAVSQHAPAVLSPAPDLATAADGPSVSSAALLQGSHVASGHASLGRTRQGSVQKWAGRSKSRKHRDPLHSMRALQSHPFFAARADAAGTASGNWASVQNEDAFEEPGDEERLLLPACVHWGLEQLGKHVTASKRLMLQNQAPQGRSTAAPSKAPRKGRGSLGLPPRPRMTAGGAPPSKAHLQRRPSKLGKRKPEWDASDFVHPAGLSSGAYVERPQVQDIRTPSVRLIGREQLQERQASIRTIHSQRRLATGLHRPGEAPADSGSSSEDTSDEIYAIRHTKKEEEERAKYLTWAGGAQKRNPKVPNPAPTAKPANIKLYRGDSGLNGPVVEPLKHPVQPTRPLSPFLESLHPESEQPHMQQPADPQNPHLQQVQSPSAPKQPTHSQATHFVAPPTLGVPPSPPKPAVQISGSVADFRGPQSTDQPPALTVANPSPALADVVPALAPAAASQPLPAVTSDQRSPRPSPTASPLRGPSTSSQPASRSSSPGLHPQASSQPFSQPQASPQSFPQPFWTTPNATPALQAQGPSSMDIDDKEAAGHSGAASHPPADDPSPPARKEEDGGSGQLRSTRSSSQKAAEAAAAAGLQLRSRSRTPAQSSGRAPTGRSRGRPPKASLSPSDQAPQSAGPSVVPKATVKERGRRASAPAGDTARAPARRGRKGTRNR
ncbi:hypothetical protein WJX74_006951 [Apatococcus lobatus]|uniref:Bromo domain-containing protein n=1 Tax=Apatococcus lobatus TaxID=904363 RepID=A0AAW1SAL2_9CHLO